MTRPGVDTVKILKVLNNNHTEQDDLLVVEEPLEIRMGYGPLSGREQKSLAVTLRTPGNDLELALGFLYSEGIIDNFSEVESVKYCEDVGKQEEKGNVVRVEISPNIKPDFEKLERNFYMTSSCGVCGKASIDAVRVFAKNYLQDRFVDKSLIEKLPT